MANVPPGHILQWLTEPSMVDARTRHEILSCWRDVSNAGGAVGFPFLPVEDAQVLPAVDAMIDSLDPLVCRLLLATVGESLAGWLLLVGNTTKVTAHWARVLRVQTAVAYRRTGIGRSMMTEASRAARDDMGLQQLHLELRAGLGLESFYAACGWREVGRWPAALRLSGDDYRDEVLMVLELR